MLLAASPPLPAEDRPAQSFVRAGYTLGASAALGAGEGQRIRAREYDLQARFGSLALEQGTLTAGVDYRYTRYEFEGLASRDWDLHWLRLPVTWRRAWAGRLVTATVAPGIASSSNRFKAPDAYTSEDLDVAAGLEVTGAISPTARWSAGLRYDRRFGWPALYPTGGALVQAGNWMLRLVAPDPELSYAPSARLRWFGFLAPAGHRWHAFNAAADRRFDFESRSWRAAAGAELRLMGGLSIRIFAGRELGRHYEFIDDLGRPVDEDAADENFAGVSFVMPAFAAGDFR